MEKIELINQIGQFYDSAWHKLLITGGVIITICGIVVPILFHILQKRTRKLRENELKDENKKEIKKLEKDLRMKIRKEFNKELKSIEVKIGKESTMLQGMGHHLQGNQYLRENDYKRATIDHLLAFKFYSEGTITANRATVKDNLIDVCIPKITSSELRDILLQLDVTLESYFDNLKVNYENQEIRKDIRELRYNITKKLSESDLKPKEEL